MQARVNLEVMTADGSARPARGVLSAYDQPSGPGVRVDGFGYAGYATSPSYDPLLAKVIVAADDLAAGTVRARRALSEFKIEGARTNIAFLQALLKSPALAAGELHTRYVEEHAAELLQDAGDRARSSSRLARSSAEPAPRSTRWIPSRCWTCALEPEQAPTSWPMPGLRLTCRPGPRARSRCPRPCRAR